MYHLPERLPSTAGLAGQCDVCHGYGVCVWAVVVRLWSCGYVCADVSCVFVVVDGISSWLPWLEGYRGLRCT